MAKRRRRRSKARRGGRRRGGLVIVRGGGNRRSRSRFRRNPGGGLSPRGLIGFAVQGLKDGAMVVAGKVAARGIPQLIGVTPIGKLGLAIQALAAFGAGFGVSRFNRDAGRMVFAGGVGAVIESFIRGANVPFVSATLGDETELYALAGYVQAPVIAGPGPSEAGRLGDYVGAGGNGAMLYG